MLNDQLLNVREASVWASGLLGKNVTPSNISYLIQYGRVRKYNDHDAVYVSKIELGDYYRSYNGGREVSYQQKLGGDLNWALSFDKYKEAETTKHVHRLHPYKGKFIPQLVEYFLDDHIDNFKKQVFFKSGDVILDPFCGSGTTMVQAGELGLNCIGVDISEFNSMMANCKVEKYDIALVKKELSRITTALGLYLTDSCTVEFEARLLRALSEFNSKYFPVPEYKYRLNSGEIDEKKYGTEKEKEFLPIYSALVAEYKIKLRQNSENLFLDKWYLQPVRDEMELLNREIEKIGDTKTKKIIRLILSRTARSCRATTHADLATIYEPISSAYYCSKHGKICKPLFSILKWWETYSKDTVNRLMQFDKLRTESAQFCLTGDSRNVDIFSVLRVENPALFKIASSQKIKGIFSSPPYVGLIDYHEQHAYSYEMFGFKRQDELEIGPLFKGQNNEAKQNYIAGISQVLNNSKKFLSADYDIFLVANDKYNLYLKIAENAGMQIVSQYKRPVLNRTEKDKGAYSETIFHIKEQM